MAPASPIVMLVQSNPITAIQIMAIILVLLVLVTLIVMTVASSRRCRQSRPEPFRPQSFYRRGSEIWMSDGVQDTQVNLGRK